MCLLHMDPPIIMNLKKIRRLMNKYHLYCPVRRRNPYRQMQKAIKRSDYADNLLMREFEGYGPGMMLLTDITYIHQQIKDAVDDYMDYYNNESYVWDLAYLSANEYDKFVMTGKYPLDIPNPPKPPIIEKQPEELGKKMDSDAGKIRYRGVWN